MIENNTLDTRTREILVHNHFESIPFDDFSRRLKEGGLTQERNHIRGRIETVPDNGLDELDFYNLEENARLSRLGEEAIRAGEVGVVVLNGGMATRFGGAAKGVTEAAFGRSFLDFKLSQVAKAGQGKVPVLLMNSFATDEITKAHLADLELSCEVRHFNQMVSLRLTTTGDLFLGEDGGVSLYAPGHGDFPFALRQSGELERFMGQGGRWLTLSNVDNLAAGLDSLVIGLHIDRGRPMTVEVVAANPGDVGGFPALVDGRAMIVEAFRIPPGFDKTQISVFNTNTFVFDAAALAEEVDLDWFMVSKTVGGREAIQFERLVGQLTEFMDVTWLKVPREGHRSRFIPIKVPADRDLQKGSLSEVLRTQGVL